MNVLQLQNWSVSLVVILRCKLFSLDYQDFQYCYMSNFKIAQLEMIFEPCDLCAQSDQSSLSAWRSLGSLAILGVHSEDSDQTGRMPRLIWVFAGRTVSFVGFVIWWLIYHIIGAFTFGHTEMELWWILRQRLVSLAQSQDMV